MKGIQTGNPHNPVVPPGTVEFAPTQMHEDVLPEEKRQLAGTETEGKLFTPEIFSENMCFLSEKVSSHFAKTSDQSGQNPTEHKFTLPQQLILPAVIQLTANNTRADIAFCDFTLPLLEYVCAAYFGPQFVNTGFYQLEDVRKPKVINLEKLVPYSPEISGLKPLVGRQIGYIRLYLDLLTQPLESRIFFSGILLRKNEKELFNGPLRNTLTTREVITYAKEMDLMEKYLHFLKLLPL